MRYPRRFSSRRKAGSIRAVCALVSCSSTMPLPSSLDSGEEQLQFLLRGHRQPVARPDVGAEHHDVAGLQPVEQRGVRGETGKAEKRRGRHRCGAGRKARIRLRRCRGRSRLPPWRAPCGASRGCENVWWPRLWPSASSRRAISGCASTLRPSRKKVAQHAFVLERVENFRGGGRPRPVVEGEHQFLWPQRQGDGELLAADPRRAGGVDRKHARGAERVRIARAGRGRGGQGNEGDEGGDGNAAVHGSNLCANHLPIPRGPAYKRRALSIRRPRPA